MKQSRVFITGICLFVLMTACKKEDSPPPVVEEPKVTEAAKVVIDLNPIFGSENLQFQKYYINEAGDSVSVTKFSYYVSNVVFVKSDGSTFAEPESYHLIDHSGTPAKNFTVSNVPVGEFTDVRFVIGIDSLRNCSGAQTGDLDPAKGMFWTWNSGYIFMKLEGRAPRSAGNKAYTYHVGGYKGPNKTQKAVAFKLPGTGLKTVAAKVSRIFFHVDAAQVFKSPTTLDVSTFYYQMSEGAGAKLLSDNYKDMFIIKEVQNP